MKNEKEYFLIGQWRKRVESDYTYEYVEECRLSIGFLTDEEKDFFESETDITDVPNYALRNVSDIEYDCEIDLICIDNIPLISLKDKQKHVDGLKRFDSLYRTPDITFPSGVKMRKPWFVVNMKCLRDKADKIRSLRQIGHTKATTEPALADTDLLDDPIVVDSIDKASDELYRRYQNDTDEHDEDIGDIIAKLDGRWVVQKDFVNENINANYCKVIHEDSRLTSKNLEHWRHNGNVTWSKKNPAIGKDKAGQFLERTGKNKNAFRYRYFLLHEFDKQPLPKGNDGN
jgi:hypothetical protein